jgi:hypothetical protein
MLVEDYISEGGARIKVYDDALDNSPENRERVYKNLSRIITNIQINKYKRELSKSKSQEETNVQKA